MEARNKSRQSMGDAVAYSMIAVDETSANKVK